MNVVLGELRMFLVWHMVDLAVFVQRLPSILLLQLRSAAEKSKSARRQSWTRHVYIRQGKPVPRMHTVPILS